MVKKYKLEPPINVLELATRYAKLEVFPIYLNIYRVSYLVYQIKRTETHNNVE